MNQHSTLSPEDEAQERLRATRERLEAMGLHGERLEQAEVEQRSQVNAAMHADAGRAEAVRARQFVVANQGGRG